ncbi:uncharacterized protein DNG_04670 [Cephalotrichum gorgonifer]|uniref:Uncharacterized protein n=1 Tax=Cephalotrichum gorgonifer TaxID=2041049 RepID=A0AAE8SVJ0_9PEZI|nr:uncharacterized protein DNG_04670 [Cephalotrichum gorgonifer]
MNGRGRILEPNFRVQHRLQPPPQYRWVDDTLENGPLDFNSPIAVQSCFESRLFAPSRRILAAYNAHANILTTNILTTNKPKSMSEDSDSDPGPSVVGIIRFDVVEEAPSHDDTPCISVWEDKKAEDERLAKWVQGGRPKYTIQIYDTTPNSRDDLRHLKTLALKLHKDTYKDRMGRGDPDREDRLDVYGLAMPAGTSDEDRVKQCIAHQEVEIISRNSTGKSDFYISGTYDAQSYQRFLVIIDGDINIQTDADPDESPFLVVFWGFPEKARQEIMTTEHGRDHILEPNFEPTSALNTPALGPNFKPSITPNTPEFPTFHPL